MLNPIYEDDDFFKADLFRRETLDFTDSDETARCLYIPVHVGQSFTGLFYIRGEEGNRKLGHDPRNVQMICQMFHQRYCELWKGSNYGDIKFTDREKEALQWMSQGKSNSVIGGIVGISKHTVEVYLRSIFKKLAVTNRTSAAVKASELGLLDPYMPLYLSPASAAKSYVTTYSMLAGLHLI